MIESYLMSENKPRISVTIEQDLLDWMDRMIDGKVFANRSHAVEACLYWYMNKGERSPHDGCDIPKTNDGRSL